MRDFLEKWKLAGPKQSNSGESLNIKLTAPKRRISARLPPFLKLPPQKRCRNVFPMGIFMYFPNLSQVSNFSISFREFGGFLKYGYPRSSSIYRWIFPGKTSKFWAIPIPFSAKPPVCLLCGCAGGTTSSVELRRARIHCSSSALVSWYPKRMMKWVKQS